MENPIETTDEAANEGKKRHGCVTAWLVIMIIGNSLAALIYLFAGDFLNKSLPKPISTTTLILLTIIGVANVAFAILLLRWNKSGFWGFVMSAIAALTVNLSVGLGIGQCILGLAGIGVLYAILQIKQDGISAWDNME
jgi:hypothetical protein